MTDPTDADAAVWAFDTAGIRVDDVQTDTDALEVRLVTIERTLIALTNSVKELFARLDSLDEQVELGR